MASESRTDTPPEPKVTEPSDYELVLIEARRRSMKSSLSTSAETRKAVREAVRRELWRAGRVLFE